MRINHSKASDEFKEMIRQSRHNLAYELKKLDSLIESRIAEEKELWNSLVLCRLDFSDQWECWDYDLKHVYNKMKNGANYIHYAMPLTEIIRR